MKKKVWAEFEVDETMETADVALALELRFKAEGNTATVWGTARDAVIEMDMTDLTRISTEADWLELGDGQRGLLIGRLDARLHEESLNFTVTNTAWESFFVDAAEAITPIIPARAEVNVVVERYEDGIALVSIREAVAA